jgi:hypothetical protein
MTVSFATDVVELGGSVQARGLAVSLVDARHQVQQSVAVSAAPVIDQGPAEAFDPRAKGDSRPSLLGMRWPAKQCYHRTSFGVDR